MVAVLLLIAEWSSAAVIEGKKIFHVCTILIRI